MAAVDLFDLHGKVALVTGGNGGIGLGIARGLAQAGADVMIAARDKGKLAAAVGELQSHLTFEAVPIHSIELRS